MSLASKILQRVLPNPTATVIRGETTTSLVAADTGIFVPADVSCVNLAATTALVGTVNGGVINVATDLGVTGAANLGGGANVTGDSSVTGDLDVSGLVSGNALNIGPGDANVANLVATGDVQAATFNGGVFPSGDAAALSVLGRSANTTGARADIVGADGQVLRVAGTALGFGTIVAAGLASDAVVTAKILDANVTLAKLANLANATVIGRNTSGTGVPEAVTMVQLFALFSAANDTITTAGSNVTDLDVSSLDGDNDGDYEFWITILGTGGAAHYTLQPNNASTNQAASGVYSDPSTSPGSEDRTDIFVGNTGTAGGKLYIHGYLASKSGRDRSYHVSIKRSDTGVYAEFLAGVWTGSGNITGLRLHCDVASRIGTGSFIRLRRMRNLT